VRNSSKYLGGEKLKKLNGKLITRLLFLILQLILLILLITPCYSQDYTQQDLDQALNSGANAYSKGDYKGAMEEFSKAVTISESLYGKEHTQTAPCYNNLGTVYRVKGDYDKAISYYEQAMTIWLKALGPGHINVATSYNNLGAAYESKGEYDQAISYFEKALDIRLKVLGPEHPNVATCYNNLGETYRTKGDYDKAKSYYEKALDIRLKALGPEHRDVATSYNSLGLACDSKGEYDKAISYLEKALAIRLKVLQPDHPDVALSYNNLGVAYRTKGDYDKAISYHEKALAIRVRALGPEHPGVAASYSNLGDDYRAKNDYDRAISCYEKALAIKTYPGQDAIITSANIGQLYLGKKEYVKAQAYLQKGIEIIEKARLEMGTGKNEFMGRNIVVYQIALRILVLMGDKAGAFRMAEMMKERGFLDQLSLNAALNSEGIDPKDRNQAMELAQGIESITLSLQSEINKPESKQDKGRLLALSNYLEAKEKGFTVLEKKLIQNGKYRNLRNPSITTLENAQALCDERTAILEYVIWEGTDNQGRQYCMVIKKNGFKFIELSPDFEYNKVVKEFRKVITSKKEAENMDSEAALLYDNLIKPLAGSLIGIKRLIVVPDEALAFLPFDVLKNKDTGRYLGEDYLISLSPSVSVFSMVKQRRFNSKRSQFLGFGGVYYAEKLSENRGQGEGIRESDASEKLKKYYAQRTATEGMNGYYQVVGLKWPYLPGTLEEVTTIKNRVFNQKENKIITGSDATEAKVKELSRSQELSKYRIIHFACHGYYNQDYPSLSSIVFSEVSGLVRSAEDGYLSVEEATLLNLNADIVNLSACETGLGKIEQGDGVIGLTRAFQVAGANMVGVTLWTVDDQATMEFMVSVYEKVYIQGKTYIEAYAETKREFMHSNQYSSPYYWCPFVLYGQ
jgi:tetratricopeptide (TPR) repeat protein